MFLNLIHYFLYEMEKPNKPDGKILEIIEKIKSDNDISYGFYK